MCVSRRDVCFFSGRTAERREIGDALRRSAGSGGKGRDNVATYENNKPCREAQGVVAEMRLEHKR